LDCEKRCSVAEVEEPAQRIPRCLRFVRYVPGEVRFSVGDLAVPNRAPSRCDLRVPALDALVDFVEGRHRFVPRALPRSLGWIV
jgi:hypothetical protein